MMKKLTVFLMFVCLVSFSGLFAQGNYTLVIHGGAGNVDRERVPEDREEAFYAKLNEALDAGESILEAGGSSLEAVEAAVRIMEDSPKFNAGRGAVFTHEGGNELDASIMCGQQMTAGAIAGVTNIRNPISTARKVMDLSPHVLLTGRGAEGFAMEHGAEIVDPSYFFDQYRYDQLQERLRQMDETGYIDAADMMGTVGAVALDKNGNLAAATSTGGMTAKRYNRVGDSPIIGAGTYAENSSCAVSATGHGEYFIKYAVAYDVSAQMRYKGAELEEATGSIIHGTLRDLGVNGGLIAVDKDGNVSMPFNTSGMFRGYTRSDGERVVKIFGDDE